MVEILLCGDRSLAKAVISVFVFSQLIKENTAGIVFENRPEEI